MLTGIIIGGTALSLLIAAIIIIANIQDRVEKNKHLASKSKVQAIKRPPVNPPQPKSYSSDDRWAQEKEIMNKARGLSGISGISGFAGYRGVSGYAGFSGHSGFSGDVIFSAVPDGVEMRLYDVMDRDYVGDSDNSNSSGSAFIDMIKTVKPRPRPGKTYQM